MPDVGLHAIVAVVGVDEDQIEPAISHQGRRRSAVRNHRDELRPAVGAQSVLAEDAEDVVLLGHAAVMIA